MPRSEKGALWVTTTVLGVVFAAYWNTQAPDTGDAEHDHFPSRSAPKTRFLDRTLTVGAAIYQYRMYVPVAWHARGKRPVMSCSTALAREPRKLIDYIIINEIFPVRRGITILGFFAGWLGLVPVATSGELVPHAHQLDIALDNFSGLVTSTSHVQVRENLLKGTRLHLASALGIRRMDIPRMEVTYWFDDRNAIQVYFRYFDAAGSHRLRQPATFNGATLAPGQRLSPRGTLWMDGAVYYERRLTPWLQSHFGVASLLNNLDLRVKLGLEFSYIDFRLNNGHARVTSDSPKGESSEDFFLQELPMPTLGMEVYGQLSTHVTVEATAKGNWINRWNSLRDEGGTVYTSQLGFETHWRLHYSDPAWLGALQPFVGLGYCYYRQNEQSQEDGNFIRLSVFGPEFGVSYHF